MTTSPASQDKRRQEVLRQQLEKLDVIVREVYGCTFREYVSQIFLYASESAFEEGWQKGRASGRRAAKGIKGERKKRGRPLEIDPGIRALLTHHVDKEREKRKTVKEAVSEFLQIMRVGSAEVRRLKLPKTEMSEVPLPNKKQGVGAYYRDRGQKHS